MSTPAVNHSLRIENGFLKYFDTSIPVEEIEVAQLSSPQITDSDSDTHYSIHIAWDTLRDKNLNGFSFAEAVKGMTLLLSATPAKISLDSLESAHLLGNRVSLDFFHGINAEKFKTFYAPAFFPEDQYEYKIEDGNPNRLKREEKGNRFTVIAKEGEGQKINQALENMSKHLCDSDWAWQKK